MGMYASNAYSLCRINMFLHDIGYEKFSIGHGDTLTGPLHWDRQYKKNEGVYLWF